MKFSPPGFEPYVTVHRLDGFLGGDPRDVPNWIANRIVAEIPALKGRIELERIKDRVLVRQLNSRPKKRISTALRQRFGLLTR
jgi:hypothetical protein